MAEMEKLQMMNLYVKSGIQTNTSSKGAEEPEEPGEFQKLLKDRLPELSKKPAEKADKDLQSKEAEQTGDSGKVFEEEIKLPEQMAELLVMMNAVQESAVQQPEPEIVEGAPAEYSAEELLSVKCTADGMPNTQMFQEESVIEARQDLKEEEILQDGQMPQESRIESGRPDAKETAEVHLHPMQKAAEQKVADEESRIHTEPQKPQEHLASAAMQMKENFAMPEDKDSTDVKLLTTENTLPEDLAKTVAEKFSGKSGMLRLELEPGSLGKLTIQMVYEEGKTVVSLMATNARTLELLSQRSAEIASILEDRTGEKTEILMYEPQKNDSYTDNQKEKEHGREEERRRNRKQESSASFLHQLRLGLV